MRVVLKMLQLPQVRLLLSAQELQHMQQQALAEQKRFSKAAQAAGAGRKALQAKPVNAAGAAADDDIEREGVDSAGMSARTPLLLSSNSSGEGVAKRARLQVRKSSASDEA
jgi:hypothetical protein